MNEQKKQPTSERLADALRGAGAPDEMVQKALAGCYDDYKSDVLCPIRELVDDCRQAGLQDMAQRAIDGEFDGQAWEAEEWAASPEGQATLKERGLL